MRTRKEGETPEEYLQELRWDCEMKMSSKCYSLEKEASKRGEDYECTCVDPMKWSYEECKEYLGEKEE